MSDLNTEILISANAEGVEAGVGRAKKSLSSLGDTAQKIGKNGADGMQALGAGADMSARKVESATKNMVGSLQRQIAAMEAGDKTSRKYQETLARMRGVDVAALKPYLDQLDSLQVKTSLAEKAQASFNSVMLKGAAVFAAAGAIASYVKIINDGVDALNDLKDATGASIENISALEDVGKRAGASFDVVSTSLIKFNNVLSDAKPGSAAEQAIKALGLSIEDLKRLDPAEALRQTSVALNRFADDGDKARLVQELFGKSVKEVAPFLKDLAESGALVAKVTTEQAEQAEKFNKELSALGKNAQDASRALVGPMVSALNDVIAKFKEGREAGKSFLEIANSRYWSNIRDFYGMTQPAAPSTGGATGSWGDGPDSKPSVGPLPDTKKPKGPTKAELSEYDKLIQKLGVDLPKAAADAEAAQMGYNKAQAEFLALAGSGVWAKFTSSQRANVAALFESKIASEQAADATRTLAKGNTEAAQAREKYLTSLSTGLDKIQADIAAQIESTERMGLSKEAIAELDAAKLEMLATDLELQAVKALDRNLDQQTYGALKAQAQAYRELGIAKKGGAAKEAALDLEKANAEAAKKAQEDWERASEQINNTLTDALMRGFESGKDFAKNLRDTVVNMFKTMVLRPVISAIINPISQGITGMMGLSGAAQAATGGAGALSTVGSIGSGVSMLSGLGAFGGGVAGGFGGLMGSLGMSATGATFGGAMSAGSIALGAGNIAGGLGTLAGALGPIALAVGLLSSLIKKSTPHMGAASSYSAETGLVSGADIYRASGLADTRTYNAGVEQVTGNVAKAIGDTLNATARTFGKEAGYEISTAFADDTSKDGAWGSLMIRRGGESVIDWRDTQTSKWAPREFADGEAGSKEYLAAVAKSARDALVGAIGDVDWATDMLTALGDSPTLEGLAQTVQQINAAQAAFDALGKNIVGFGALTDGAISALVKAAGSIDGLVSAASAYYDNFYSEAEKAADVTRDVTAALADVGLEMPKTRDEFRAMVEAQMALGESGAPAVAALLGVSGAFAALTPTLDAMVASVGINAEQISTTLRDGLLGRISGEEMGASIGTMITNGIQNAIAGSFADQITQIFMQGIVNPVIQAAMTGSSISAAVSQASIDAMVKQAQGAAAAIGAILNDPGFQSAMAQIQAAIGSFTTASSVGYRAPVVSGGGGGYDSGGFSDSVEAVDTAWKDLLASIVESTLAAQTELSRLGMTSYERALAEIDDKANDLLKQIAEDRGFADMRTQLAGAEQRQSSFSALAASIRATIEQSGDYLINGGTKWLSDLGAEYQRDADAAAEAIARLRGELVDMPEEVRKLIEAERALLEARNALRAMEITGDLRTDIERLGMSDMERTLAGIGDRAKDYIKSLQDIGQATEENIGVVGEWEKAMRLDAIKKAWEGVSESMLDEIDRIRGSLAGDGGLAALQAEFAINTAAARAGDKDAAGSLAGLSRDILRMQEGRAGSAFDWARIQAQMLASLEESARIAALMGQGGGSSIVDGRIISEAHTQQPGQTIVGHHGMGGEIAYPIVTPYIPPAPQSSNAELIAEIRLLNRRLETLEANTQATALHTQKTSKALERAMPGGDAIATREVAA